MFTFNDSGNNITEHSNILISPFRANVIAFALFFILVIKITALDYTFRYGGSFPRARPSLLVAALLRGLGFLAFPAGVTPFAPFVFFFDKN